MTMLPPISSLGMWSTTWATFAFYTDEGSEPASIDATTDTSLQNNLEKINCFTRYV
jgi:hypothetical protein